jgi:hypothetical protein
MLLSVIVVMQVTSFTLSISNPAFVLLPDAYNIIRHKMNHDLTRRFIIRDSMDKAYIQLATVEMIRGIPPVYIIPMLDVYFPTIGTTAWRGM